MLCRFFFALWWSFFVWCIWHHVRPAELHVWSIDRHTTTVLDVSLALSPLKFQNLSVLWVDTLTDRVHLDLLADTTMGTVSVKKAMMNVYENGFNDKLMEVYPVDISYDSLENAHLNMLQNDTHFSPFRSIVLEPKIEWLLGGNEITAKERVGYVKNGRWYEGDDPMQLGGSVLFAWCMGIIFLVVMRRPNSTETIIVQEQVSEQKKEYIQAISF